MVIDHRVNRHLEVDKRHSGYAPAMDLTETKLLTKGRQITGFGSGLRAPTTASDSKSRLQAIT